MWEGRDLEGYEMRPRNIFVNFARKNLTVTTTIENFVPENASVYLEAYMGVLICITKQKLTKTRKQ